MHSYTKREIPRLILKSSNIPNRVCCRLLCTECAAFAGLDSLLVWKPARCCRVCCTVSYAGSSLTLCQAPALAQRQIRTMLPFPVLVERLYLTLRNQLSRPSWLFFPLLPKNLPLRRYHFVSTTFLKLIPPRGLFPAFSLFLSQVIFALVQLGVYRPLLHLERV